MNKIKSNKEYRFKDNPEEQRFFENFIKDRYDLYKSISYICFGKDKQVTERDINVFLSAIQWLGSPVGQYFLKDVMGYRNVKLNLTDLTPKDKKEIKELTKQINNIERITNCNLFETWDEILNKFYNNEPTNNRSDK